MCVVFKGMVFNQHNLKKLVFHVKHGSKVTLTKIFSGVSLTLICKVIHFLEHSFLHLNFEVLCKILGIFLHCTYILHRLLQIIVMFYKIKVLKQKGKAKQ